MIEPNKPIRIEDFDEISSRVRGFELQPGKHYLIVADGKKFTFEGVWALLKDLRECHPELDVFIIATPDSSKISVMEEKP